MRVRPKVVKNREATKEELKCIKETEEMLVEEHKLPPASQMIRNIATDHWMSLKAWVKGSQVIAPQEIAQKRWEICKQCPHLLYDETNPDTGKRDGRCTHCGCFMNIKVHYAVSKCPIDKWTDDCKCNQKKKCEDNE